MKYRPHLLAAALLAAGATAHAAPYAIRYTGTIAGSTIAGVQDGQSYEVTLIVDNGGTTAASQQWGREHLRCTLWRMNNQRDHELLVDLGNHPPSTYGGSVTTAADGTLTGMFSTLVSSGLGAGQYTASHNLDLPPALTWRIGGSGSQNGLYAGGGTASVTTFRDAVHGAPSAQPGDWSAPRRVRGSSPCSDIPGPTVPRNPSATPGDARLDVTWQLPILVPGDTQARRYGVTASPYGGGTSHSCQANHPATTCSLTGLTNGTAYRVWVMAAGPDDVVLGQSESVTATPFAPGAPGAPTGVTATPGDARVTLQWQAPTTGAAPTSYRVAAAPGNAGCTAQAPATTCTVPGLTNGTGYTFTVYAVNGVGESAAAGVGPIVPVAGQRGPGDATPVPALGLPALILLGAGAAGLGALRLRRRS